MASAAPTMSSHRTSPFSKRTVLALVIASFLAFLALLALIGAGQTSRSSNDGGNHARANGLNGFSGLVELLRLEGRDVTISRSPGGFDTNGLLVLTPPMNADEDDIQEILDARFYTGPTLIILPKWYARQMDDNLSDEVEIEDGWVRLLFTAKPGWIEEIDEPFWLSVQQPWRDTLKAIQEEEEAAAEQQDETLSEDNLDINTEDAPEEVREALEDVIIAMNNSGSSHEKLETVQWSGYGLSGELPDTRVSVANDTPGHEAMVTTSDGKVLVSYVLGEEDSDFYNYAFPVIFVIEPDLMNNYGLSDETRAAAALAILEELTYDWDSDITFDVSLNGLGGSENLLTLAFRPPFLAATLCLILALVIVGWRAFLRFGPPLAESQAIAFGKRRLVSNGAGLILRARRLQLLADPYIALVTRRIGKRLGMRRPTTESVSETLSQRMPSEEPLIDRAAALRNARKPKDILRAARALKELERKLES